MLRRWGGSGELVVELGMLGGPEEEARRWRQWRRCALFHVGLSTTTYGLVSMLAKNIARQEGVWRWACQPRGG
jgi:hypothetical protein